MSNPWKTLASRSIYENRWISVREDRVLRPDGGEGIYGVVDLRPSVAVVAVDAEERIALVGQWRYPLGRYSWEIPRGGSNRGEDDMQAAARRELREEAGVTASRWSFLGALDQGNGVMNDVEHIYLARELSAVGVDHDAEEKIAVRWTPCDQAIGMIFSGEITECCSVAALLMAREVNYNK